ncbi:YdeI/OmpD-associated family protein [Phenylobacterium sp.]|uniref:YdeI/OmpD-associated family protein n=1 Tax=Phenylobacterium sp. TaxID=1871053 RepID=UPI0035692FEC
MKFRTTILQGGKTTTGIHVPDEVVAALGTSRKPAVKVTLNGYSYRSTVAVMGERFMVGVSAEVREKSGVKGGDTLDVEIELDTAPRVLEIPADFAAALAAEPAAKAAFEALSYSNKRRHTMPIEDAKAPETRARRIEKSVENLEAGKG